MIKRTSEGAETGGRAIKVLFIAGYGGAVAGVSSAIVGVWPIATLMVTSHRRSGPRAE